MIIEDLSFQEYIDLPGWNWSKIKLLQNYSPKHVKYAMTAPDNDTASRGWLRAVHSLVLEPHRFREYFVTYTGTRNRRHKAYQAHLEAFPAHTTLTPKESDSAVLTAAAIRAHAPAAELLSTGRPELTITWKDEATGLDCKGRIDWLTADNIIADLKTIGAVDERHVSSIVARNLYHGQMAHYASGLQHNGVTCAGASIIAAEGKGAQDVAVYELDLGFPDGALYVGEQMRERLMRQLAECVEHDEWPGRHPTAQTLNLPAYALEDHSDAITFGD